MTGVWLDLNVEWFRALGTEVKQSVGRLRLLLAVATPAHVALIFAVAILLVCRREMGRGGGECQGRGSKGARTLGAQRGWKHSPRK